MKEKIKLWYLRKWKPERYKELETIARYEIYALEDVAAHHEKLAYEAREKAWNNMAWHQWTMVEDRERGYHRLTILEISELKKKFPGITRGENVAKEIGIL